MSQPPLGRNAATSSAEAARRNTQHDTFSLPSTRELSLAHRFVRRAQASPSQIALRYPENGEWHALSWAGWLERARHAAAALASLGVREGDRVAIQSRTRIEWVLADQAIWMLGAVSVPIYEASTAAQVAFILEDSQARWLLCEDVTRLAKVFEHGDLLDTLAGIVSFDPGAAPSEIPLRGQPLLAWRELEAAGAAHWSMQGPELELRLHGLTPGSLATIAYTSGTSGTPKGARITHENLLHTSEASVGPLGIDASDVQLVFLPLAHIVARQLVASSLVSGCTTVLDASPLNLLANCRQWGVTYFCGVPRILEKLHASFASLPAEQLHRALGGRVRFIMSGGAPLQQPVTDFFRERGVPVYEGYGLTETTGTLTLNVPQHYRHGSVGRVAAGTELRVSADGEVLACGPGVMEAYHRRPEETRAALTLVDGRRWFHTGDVGHIDADGFLWLTDRKKDLFKLSTGKYVAPAPLEARVKSSSSLVSQVVVYGDNKPYVTALCTLTADAVAALQQELGVLDAVELHRHPEVERRVQQVISTVNESVAPFERIKKFALIYPDFALAAGELTPTLKLRRRAVADNYRVYLESLYGESA